MSEAYKQLLKDKRWQMRRLYLFERDGWDCTNPNCPDLNAFLQVHHLRYCHGLLPWEYPDEDLVTLCETCHKAAHKITEPVYFVPCIACGAKIEAATCAGKDGCDSAWCEPCATKAEQGRVFP